MQRLLNQSYYLFFFMISTPLLISLSVCLLCSFKSLPMCEEKADGGEMHKEAGEGN